MPIKDAINRAGGVGTVAKHFGISPVSVYEWISAERLPADRVIPLAKLTEWAFTPHTLNPNLYPNPHDGLPVEEQLEQVTP